MADDFNDMLRLAKLETIKQTKLGKLLHGS